MFIKKGKIKKNTTALLVVKKLPELLKGKSSKKIIKKNGKATNLILELEFCV